MVKFLKGYFFLVLVMLPGLINAQCTITGLPFDCLPAPFAAGGAVGASGSVFCVGEPVGVYSTSTGNIDSSYICWGDGTISGFTGNFTDTVYHNYNFKPDSCVGASGIIQNTIYIFVIDSCANGTTVTWNSFPISVKFKPHVIFQFADDSICTFQDITIFTFGACGNSNNANYTWDFGDGTIVTSTNPAPPPHSYSSTGNYTVKFVIDQGISGCGKDSLSKVINVRPPTFVNPVVAVDSCAPQIFIPSINSVKASTYNWTVSPGGITITPSPTDSQPTFNVTNGGTYSINLQTTGCCYGIAVCQWDTTLTFYDGPSLSTIPIPPACNSASINPLNYFQIVNPNNIISGYQWSFPGGVATGSTSSANPGTVNYSTDGTYVLSLIVTSSCGNDTITDTLQIGKPPLLNVTPVSFIGCDSLTTLFNNSSPANQTYSWIASGGNFINSTSNNSASPQINFVGAGSYSITVTASTPGCPGIQQNFPVTIKQSPRLTQLSNFPDGCDSIFSINWNSLFNLIPLSSDSGYLWTATRNGFVFYSNATSAPPAVNFNATGTYILTALAWNECDSIVLKDTFLISTPVVLSLSNDTSICKTSGLFSLNANASGGLWSWNGTLTTSPINPNNATQVINTLVYSYGGGNCAVRDSFQINVIGADVFAGNDVVLCGNTSSFQFNAVPAGGIYSGMGIMNINTGLYNPNLVSASPDTIVYTVFDVTNNCTTRDTLYVTLNSATAAAFSIPDTVCLGIQVPFVNSLVNTIATWDFGDGSVAVTNNSTQHSYSAQGNYIVTLILLNAAGCRDTIHDTIAVIIPPDAIFSVNPLNGCADLTAIISNQSIFYNNSLYIWNYGNGIVDTIFNPGNITFSQGVGDSTVYNIILTASNSCGFDQYTIPITVYPKPIADFGIIYNDSCSPALVKFANVTTGAPDNFQWFINGNFVSTDSILSPHIFLAGTSDSTYSVKLIATNQCGSDTVTKNVIVHPNNVVAFFNTDVLRGCKPLTVKFTSFVAPNAVIQWSFGDGNFGTGDTIIHQFDTTGTFTVWQFVDNTCGFDSVSQSIIVYPPPEVKFSVPTVNCVNNVVPFQNTSVNTFGGVWDYGDGSPLDSSLSSPTHKYALPGFYNVSLTGISANSACRATHDSVIRIYDIPTALFTINDNNGCVPLKINLDGNNSLTGNYFQWDMGNTDTVNGLAGSIQSYTYLNSGSYTVRLTVIDGNGCADDTIFSPVIVHDNPVADFNFNQQPPCVLPSTIQFVNQSILASGFQWDLNSYGTSLQQNPLINVNAVDSFKVILIADNIFGCKDTIEKTIETYDAVTADFIPSMTAGCYPLEVQFSNNANNVNQYLWDFGDGYFSSERDPIHTYLAPGLFTVTLFVNNDSICFASMPKTDLLEVFPAKNPIAAFIVDPPEQSIVNPEFSFINNSVDADSVFWNFGDGQFSLFSQTNHVYADTGTYKVILIVKNSFGCPDTMTKFVIVKPEFVFYIPNSFTPNGDLKNDEFNVKGWFIEDVKLSIFDRWGKRIFHSEGRENESWNGKVNNSKEAEEAIYIYDALIREPNGVLHKRRGKIALIR